MKKQKNYYLYVWHTDLRTDTQYKEKIWCESKQEAIDYMQYLIEYRKRYPHDRIDNMKIKGH